MAQCIRLMTLCRKASTSVSQKSQHPEESCEFLFSFFLVKMSIQESAGNCFAHFWEERLGNLFHFFPTTDNIMKHNGNFQEMSAGHLLRGKQLNVKNFLIAHCRSWNHVQLFLVSDLPHRPQLMLCLSKPFSPLVSTFRAALWQNLKGIPIKTDCNLLQEVFIQLLIGENTHLFFIIVF